MGVEGIAGSQADVLLRITLRDGRRLRHVLKAEAPSFRIDADSSRAGIQLGQFAFVGAVLLVIAALRRVPIAGGGARCGGRRLRSSPVSDD